jgi:hypothetical protein
MEEFKSPLFIVCAFLFLLHQGLQHLLKFSVPLADAYLDNLVAMPLILTLLQAERRHLFKKGPQYKLPLLEIILATIYVSAISEFLFPVLTTRFTYDALDFVFFFLGAALFYSIEKQSAISDTSLKKEETL